MVWLIFPFFSVWWWVLTLGFFGWLLFYEETEHPLEALCVLLLYCVLFTLIGDFVHVLSWVLHKGWLVLLALFIGYLPAGFCWGVFRYWWEQSRSVAKYQDAKIDFLRRNGLTSATEETDVPENLLREWIGMVGLDRPSYAFTGMRRFFQDQKKRVINWMAWWWLSMLSFFLKDFILRFYEIVLSKTRKLFEAIDRRVWGNVEGDFTRMEAYLEEQRRQREEDTQRQREERVRPDHPFTR